MYTVLFWLFIRPYDFFFLNAILTEYILLKLSLDLSKIIKVFLLFIGLFVFELLRFQINPVNSSKQSNSLIIIRIKY